MGGGGASRSVTCFEIIKTDFIIDVILFIALISRDTSVRRYYIFITCEEKLKK
jgi:hypothetical protein